MKILVNKEEVKEIEAIVDVILKGAGIQALQIATKLLQSIEVVEDIPEKGIKPENTK